MKPYDPPHALSDEWTYEPPVHDRFVWGCEKIMRCGAREGAYSEDPSKVTCRACKEEKAKAGDRLAGALWRMWTR